MHMLGTAEVVYDRYGVSRESQDEYSLLSQQRTAAAQQAGLFDDEIAPLETTKKVTDRQTGETHYETVTLTKDEGNRPYNHAGGPGGVEAGGPREWMCHGGQRQPVLRRRGGRHPDEPGYRRGPGHRSRWATSAGTRRSGWSQTKWASDRCSQCPSCSSDQCVDE